MSELGKDDPEAGSTSQGRWVPPPFEFQRLTPDELQTVRHRQRSGARIMGLLLAALAILVFLITIAKQVKA